MASGNAGSSSAAAAAMLRVRIARHVDSRSLIMIGLPQEWMISGSGSGRLSQDLQAGVQQVRRRLQPDTMLSHDLLISRYPGTAGMDHTGDFSRCRATWMRSCLN